MGDPDPKDIEKPTKYNGSGWVQLRNNVENFLDRKDPRWIKLLRAIDGRSSDPLTNDKKVALADEVGIQGKPELIVKFEKQLFDYLQSYTTGDALSTVLAGRRENSWESFRILCGQGRSRLKHDMKDEYRRVIHPKQSSLEGPMKAIHAWETELTEYIAGGGRRIEEPDKISCLEEMCPDVLQDF